LDLQTTLFIHKIQLKIDEIYVSRIDLLDLFIMNLSIYLIQKLYTDNFKIIEKMYHIICREIKINKN